MAFEPSCQTLDYFTANTGAFEYETGINLHETRSSRDFLPRVRAGENAAHADNGQSGPRSAVNVTNDFRAPLAQGRTAQSATFA